jgi:hypothetical protein
MVGSVPALTGAKNQGRTRQCEEAEVHPKRLGLYLGLHGDSLPVLLAMDNSAVVPVRQHRIGTLSV